MKQNSSYKLSFVILFILLVFTFFLNLSLGSVSIPLSEIFESLFGSNTTNQSWNYIVVNFRLPKAFTAILAGTGLSLSGLLMQTLFRNPLAGPFVLGISSGASLGVAILILGASILGGSFILLGQSNLAIAIAASLGSFLVLTAVMLVAYKVKNTMAILIIGLMFGSFTAAIISVLSYFSSAENLQQYLFWSFGSLGNLSWNELLVFFLIFLFGIVLIVPNIKSLNSLLLGENYAKSLGLNLNRTRNLILIATSILTGVITAFSGPIAFIGLAVPHITKLIFNTSNHKILIPAVAMFGAIFMLLADTIAQLPTSEFVLPINAITSMFGAPVVIWLLIRKKKLSL
ncbi:MAG: iron ABC transporter permease [Bacteroidota bacterium]